MIEFAQIYVVQVTYRVDHHRDAAVSLLSRFGTGPEVQFLDSVRTCDDDDQLLKSDLNPPSFVTKTSEGLGFASYAS